MVLRRHKRSNRPFIVILATVIAISMLPIWRALHQQRLDDALIAAVKRNDTEAVVLLLSRGASANAVDRLPHRTSWRDLWLNLFRGRFQPSPKDPTALLVMLAPHPITYQNEPSTVFQEAPKNSEIVAALLQHGASADVVSADHQTPLSLAIMSGYPDSIILQLLDHGANPVFTYQGRMVDGYRSLLIEAVLRRYSADTVKALIQRGAPVDSQDSFGGTALTSAIARRHVPVVALLLRMHADPNRRDIGGYTALTVAEEQPLMFHRQALIALLKSAGAHE